MGTAVHESIETYIKTGDVSDFESIFYPLIEQQLLIDPDHHKWLSAGSGENLVQGQVAVDIGQKCVENAVKFLEDMDVWEVEFDASCNFPGLEVPVKIYIDILGEHKKHGPLIVDWKSGKQAPHNIFQLEVYKAAVLVGNDERFKPLDVKGYWGMLHPEGQPKTARGRLKDLSHVKPEEVGKRFQKAYDGMKAAIYKANTKFGCKFCVMQDNCKAHNRPLITERIKFYDKSSEDGIPF